MDELWETELLPEVEDFIEEQNTVIKTAIKADLKRLRARGLKAQYPLVAQIEGSVWELRTQVDGHGFFRLFYFRSGRKAFFFYDAYQKDSKKLPRHVRKRVLQRYKDITGKKP